MKTRADGAPDLPFLAEGVAKGLDQSSPFAKGDRGGFLRRRTNRSTGYRPQASGNPPNPAFVKGGFSDGLPLEEGRRESACSRVGKAKRAHQIGEIGRVGKAKRAHQLEAFGVQPRLYSR